MGRLKPIIEPFGSGWNYTQHAFFKLISLLMIWSCKCNNMSKKKDTSLQTLVIWVYQTTLHIFSHWISKPCIRRHKNHSKASNGARKFSKFFWEYKKSWYNVWNCKSERQNKLHSFRRYNSQHKPTSTNIPYNGLKVKGRKNGKIKTSSPCRWNGMLHAINLCQDNTLCGSTKINRRCCLLMN